MSDHQVRRLGPADVDTLRALNALFGEAFEDPETYRYDTPDDAWLSRMLSREHVFVLVAEQDGTVIGGIVAYGLEKAESARVEVYLYDLAVAESHRRRGVATALIMALKPLARAFGAWVIFVQADYVDPPAIALYSKLGTREDVLHFDIAVEERKA